MTTCTRQPLSAPRRHHDCLRHVGGGHALLGVDGRRRTSSACPTARTRSTAAPATQPPPGIPLGRRRGRVLACPDVPTCPPAPADPPPAATSGVGADPRGPGRAHPAPGAATARPGANSSRPAASSGASRPGAFTDKRGATALAAFEKKTERHQDIYHAYHRGNTPALPDQEEIAIARRAGPRAHPLPELEAVRRDLGEDRQGRQGDRRVPGPAGQAHQEGLPRAVLLHRAPRGRGQRPGEARLGLHGRGLLDDVPPRGEAAARQRRRQPGHGAGAHGVRAAHHAEVVRRHVPGRRRGRLDRLRHVRVQRPRLRPRRLRRAAEPAVVGRPDLARLLQLGRPSGTPASR